MSSTFATYTPLANAAPDPAKHVKFTLGMVMGVSDFNQQFAYHSNRDQWAVRDLLGYGTVWGLRLSQQSASVAVIQVDPGVAASPSGQLIRVCQAQCADLGKWVADPANQTTLTQQLGAPATTAVPLYVCLCYRDCDTDAVPIPGEPCRCDDQTTAASRTADDFCLQLRLTAPVQHEEDAIRRFVAWLRQIPIAPGPGSPALLAGFEDQIRNLETMFSPPLSPPSDSDWDLDFGSPPTSLFIPAGEIGDFVQAAMRIWVTELRPKWRAAFPASGCGCGCGSGGAAATTPPEDCVLLGTINLPLLANTLNSTWLLGPVASLSIDESQRPLLLHLRMIQECLLLDPLAASPTSPATSPSAPTIVAAGIVGDPAGAGPQPPVFGGLSASVTAAGVLNIAFPGYAKPDGTFQYIVKATSIDGTPTPVQPALVTFNTFLTNGFNLTVTINGTPVALGSLQQLRFMIEVTRFPL